MKRIVGLMSAAAAAAMIFGAQVGYSQESPGSVPFGEPTYSGSGCPDGSIAFAPTETAFTMLFDSYSASAGTGATWRDTFKTCTIDIPVEVPAGWQIAIDSVDYRGYASVTEKATASLKSWYHIWGKGWSNYGTSRESIFKGPADTDYFRRDVSTSSERNRWSKCGGSHKLRLHSYLYAHARRGANALIQMDAADGAASLRYGMTWKRCAK